jgi:hypothetical protein
VVRGAPRQQQAIQESGGRGWGRFGEPSAAPTVDRGAYRSQQIQAQPQQAPPSNAPARNDNFRRFDQPAPGPAVSAPRRQEAPPAIDRSMYARPNVDRNPGGNRAPAPEAVRISPPVVRERSVERMQSAPAYRPTPRSEPAARPSGNNGGGNGGGRHEGGGNGGGRREGGGNGGGRRDK